MGEKYTKTVLFDLRNLSLLEDLVQRTGLSEGEVIRESLAAAYEMHRMADDGYILPILENPSNGKQRIIVSPVLPKDSRGIVRRCYPTVKGYVQDVFSE
ncbi:MAG: hypothetical protein AABX03_02720 [Nanoarchaeota archaeon]